MARRSGHFHLRMHVENQRLEPIVNIAVAGTGYVGLSLAVLLAQNNRVSAVDVVQAKVDMLSCWESPIRDREIERFLDEAARGERVLNLRATTDGVNAYAMADLVVIATPTNYDPERNYFDTRHVEQVVELVLEVNPEAIMEEFMDVSSSD